MVFCCCRWSCDLWVYRSAVCRSSGSVVKASRLDEQKYYESSCWRRKKIWRCYASVLFSSHGWISFCCWCIPVYMVRKLAAVSSHKPLCLILWFAVAPTYVTGSKNFVEELSPCNKMLLTIDWWCRCCREAVLQWGHVPPVWQRQVCGAAVGVWWWRWLWRQLGWIAVWYVIFRHSVRLECRTMVGRDNHL